MRDDLIALGIYQAKTYWAFLFAAGVGDDVRQEVHLAALQHPRHGREFANALNRGLYSLARSCGFRKRHMNEMGSGGQWWERQALSFTEIGEWRRPCAKP